jgi:hypothetical protein
MFRDILSFLSSGFMTTRKRLLVFNKVEIKVKCTLVQALRLCTGRMTHRGSRGVALLFYYHGTRRG